MSTDPRQHLGRLGERLAAEHLERLGCAIVARNHRTRFGEIDLVACDGRTLIFVEVSGDWLSLPPLTVPRTSEGRPGRRPSSKSSASGQEVRQG
ncbi:MAG TPA: YraN family protein [Baekduia sp.]